MCAATYINKTQMPKSTSINQKSNLCSHLTTCYQHLDVIRKEFPEYFNSEDGNENVEEEVGNIDQKRNTEDDEETGLWNYKGLSEHTPKKMMDEKLKKYTCQRIQWVVQNPDKYTIMAMKPDLKNPDGTDILCNCGLVYAEDGLQQEGCATLNTCVGTVSLNYVSVKCPNKQYEISFKEIERKQAYFSSPNKHVLVMK